MSLSHSRHVKFISEFVRLDKITSCELKRIREHSSNLWWYRCIRFTCLLSSCPQMEERRITDINWRIKQTNFNQINCQEARIFCLITSSNARSFGMWHSANDVWNRKNWCSECYQEESELIAIFEGITRNVSTCSAEHEMPATAPSPQKNLKENPTHVFFDGDVF